jgi:hypothetical protein
MSKTPFNEPEDAEDKAANRAAAEDLKSKIEERTQESAEPVEVDIDAAQEEIEDSDKPTRNEKRRERYRKIQEEREQFRTEREQAQRERDQLRMEAQQMRQMLERFQPQPPQEDPLAEPREAVMKLFEEQELMYRDYSQRLPQMTEQEKAEYNKKFREMQLQMLIQGGELAVRKRGLHQAPSQEQIRSQVIQERLLHEHGDVMLDEQKRQYCTGVWTMLRAKGKPDDWNTINEAAETTRKAYGLPTRAPRPAPSDGYKRKLMGMGRGGASSGEEPRTVTMTGLHKQMANAAFKHIKDPNERYKRWAAGPGARLLDKQKTG